MFSSPARRTWLVRKQPRKNHDCLGWIHCANLVTASCSPPRPPCPSTTRWLVVVLQWLVKLLKNWPSAGDLSDFKKWTGYYEHVRKIVLADKKHSDRFTTSLSYYSLPNFLTFLSNSYCLGESRRLMSANTWKLAINWIMMGKATERELRTAMRILRILQLLAAEFSSRSWWGTLGWNISQQLELGRSVVICFGVANVGVRWQQLLSLTSTRMCAWSNQAS